MTITQTIDELPDAPDPASDSADEFSDKAATYVLAQKDMVPQLNTAIGQMNSAATQMNADAAASAASAAAAAISQASAAASAASAIAAPGTNATSSSSFLVGTGGIGFTTQTGKSFVPGMWVNIVYALDRSKWMNGYIDSYNSGVGSLAVVVVEASGIGSGPYNNWIISLGSPRVNMLGPVDLAYVGASIRPSFMADFANAKRLDARLVYAMSSPISYFDATKTLQTSPAGVPALDHDPVTGRCLGISMWEARTNVLLWCRDLTNAAWTKVNMTPALTQTGIDGVANSASSITATAANATAIQSVTLASSARYFTAFVKRIAGGGAVEMTVDNGATWTAITGSINSSTWTRCSIPTQTLANPACGFRLATSGDAIAVDYTGNENGTFATPPILTTSSAVTRNAPTLSIATSAFPFNGAEGTIYVEFSQANVTSGFPRVFCFNDGAATNVIQLITNASADTLQGEIFTGGVSQFSNNSFSGYTGAKTRVALAYKANACQIAKDGAANAPDTSVTLPVVTTLSLGHDAGGASLLNGWLSKFAYHPAALTQSEITAMATL